MTHPHLSEAQISGPSGPTAELRHIGCHVDNHAGRHTPLDTFVLAAPFASNLSLPVDIPIPPPPPQVWSGVYVDSGRIRRVWFEADSEPDAVRFAAGRGLGLEGPARSPESKLEPLPEAYDEKTARRLLGGVSRTFLYRDLVTGKLERLPGTRRLLITRASMERRARG